MKKLFIIIFFFTALSYSQVLKGRIPVDQNGRPVNHYVVDDTIVTNLKSYVLAINADNNSNFNFIKLSDLFYISSGDTLFYFDTDKKIYSVTIGLTNDNDSSFCIYLTNNNTNSILSDSIITTNRKIYLYNFDKDISIPLCLRVKDKITLYASKLSDILLKFNKPDIYFYIKYESY